MDPCGSRGSFAGSPLAWVRFPRLLMSEHDGRPPPYAEIRALIRYMAKRWMISPSGI
jgi:hypothetical protein